MLRSTRFRGFLVILLWHLFSNPVSFFLICFISY
uniref:Uncharacterized protein n=1 Tax=Rhizophora mucronata TaxID=61149 RepID=A0A2P2K0S2_RHIMU